MTDRPLKWTANNNLQEMTDGEIDYIVYTVLKKFAANTSGSGVISINSAAGTLIGTHQDTRRPFAVGTHPVNGTIERVDYDVYYNRSIGLSEASVIEPLIYDGGIKAANTTSIDSKIIQFCIDELATGNAIGSYKLSSSIPTGGTWTEIDIIPDTRDGSQPSPPSAVDYKLWRKTNDTAPTEVRPFKWNGARSIKEMTDADIESLVARLQNVLGASDIGNYELSETTPVTGTWISQGSATDTRQDKVNKNYTGYYGSSSTGYFTGSFAGKSYSRTFTGFFTNPFFGGSFAGYFTSYFSQNYTRNFTGHFGASYQGTYSGSAISAATETGATTTLWLRTA